MTDGILDKVAYQVTADIGPYNAKMAEAEQTAQKAGSAIQGHFNKSAEGAERLHRGIEINRRELLYAGRELATGDFQRLPATLLLIGTHLSGLTTAGIAMTAAIVAPFAAMATAAVQYEKTAERVRIAIASTGNAAGVTSGQVFDMATSLSKSTDLSQRGATDIMSKLIGGGNVPGTDLLRGTQATDAYSKMSGLNLDKAADKISEIMADPTKAAKELHDKFNLLTDAEMLRIMAMKSTADQEKEIDDALIKRGEDVQNSMWSLSKGFDSFGSWLSNFWNNTGSMVTGGPQGVEQQYRSAVTTAQRQQLALSQHARGITPAMVQSSWAQAGDLHYQMGAGQRAAAASAAQKAKDEAAADDRSPGAMTLRRYKDEASSYGKSPRDRDMARARSEAARQFTENSASTEPGVAKRAGDIREAQINAALAEQTAKRKDNLDSVLRSATAQETLTKAYNESSAAGLKQENLNKAQEEFYKGSINDVKSYADALDREASARARMAAKKEDLRLGTDYAAQVMKNSMLQGGSTTDQIDKAVALLKAKQEMDDAGLHADDTEYKERVKLVGAMQDQLALERKLTEEKNRQMEIANSMLDILDSALNDPKSALKSVTKGIEHNALEFGVMNPLKNAVMTKIDPSFKKLPTFGDIHGTTGAIGAILGGGKAKPDGSNTNPIWVMIHPASAGVGTSPSDVAGIASMVAKGHIAQAAPHIQNGAIQQLSNAVARGFQLGGISA